MSGLGILLISSSICFWLYTFYALASGKIVNITEVFIGISAWIDNHWWLFDLRPSVCRNDSEDKDYSEGLVLHRHRQPVGYWVTVAVWGSLAAGLLIAAFMIQKHSYGA